MDRLSTGPPLAPRRTFKRTAGLTFVTSRVAPRDRNRREQPRYSRFNALLLKPLPTRPAPESFTVLGSCLLGPTSPRRTGVARASHRQQERDRSFADSPSRRDVSGRYAGRGGQCPVPRASTRRSADDFRPVSSVCSARKRFMASAVAGRIRAGKPPSSPPPPCSVCVRRRAVNGDRASVGHRSFRRLSIQGIHPRSRSSGVLGPDFLLTPRSCRLSRHAEHGSISAAPTGAER